MGAPHLILASDAIEGYALGGETIAFEFGVENQEKLRARGDLKRNLVKLCTSATTPINLPTWDHIAHPSKDVRGLS